MKNIFHTIRSGYRGYTKTQKICCWIIGINLFIALFADVLANDKPLFCICDGHWYFPAFNINTHNSNLDFNSNQCTYKIHTILPWGAGSIDAGSSGYTPPGHRAGHHIHWLGTDALGRDVFAGMIYGTRYAWIIGILSTLIAAIPGVFIGMMIGYWKNDRLRWTWGQLIAMIFWVLILFYEWTALSWIMPSKYSIILSIGILLVWYFIGRYIWKWTSSIGKRIRIPLDGMIMRGIDLFESFPKLLLLMALMIVVTRPSILVLSILIAVIEWTLFAQIARGETIKESVNNYVLAAQNINIPWYTILIKHIWPNIKRSLLVTAVFTFSASVLLEASLSFIGLGLKLEQVTWGSLMNEGRNYLPGWWLYVFPGLAIFSLLFALNWLFIIKSKSDNAIQTFS